MSKKILTAALVALSMLGAVSFSEAANQSEFDCRDGTCVKNLCCSNYYCGDGSSCADYSCGENYSRR